MIGKGNTRPAQTQKGELVSNGNEWGTKPNAPMGFAPRAQDPVSNGKPRMVRGLGAITSLYRPREIYKVMRLTVTWLLICIAWIWLTAQPAQTPPPPVEQWHPRYLHMV